MVEDLALFHELEADEQRRFSQSKLIAASKAHESFLLKYFQIRDGAGGLLSGVVVGRDVSRIPTEGVLQEDAMKVEAIYSLEYELQVKKPDFLTFLQKFGGQESLVPHVMEFIALQSGKWLEKPTRLRHGHPYSISLDWNSTGDSAPLNWRAVREKRRKELERRLGIASYTGLYSYLYLNDQELRHEILVPLLTFEKWLPLQRADPEFLQVEEQDAVREKISEWFRSRNPVEIDGVSVKPVLSRLQFFGLDVNDFARNATPRKVNVYQARIGIILSYPAKSPPLAVRMEWESFQPYAPFLRSFLFLHDANPVEHFFLEESPFWEWTRTGEPMPSRSHEIASLASASSFLESRIANGSFLVLAFVFVVILLRHVGRNGFSLRTATLFGFLLVAVSLMAYQFLQSSTLARPDDEALEAHSAALLKNVYRAYDYRDEEDVYDALQYSCSGEFLEELYLGILSGLRMQEQGGSIAKVQKVEVRDMNILPEDSRDEAVIDCTWSVTGTVEHWGHLHTRENEYSALLTISLEKKENELGKIKAFEVTDEKRVRFDTALRKLEQD